jgi:hypothetical protein
MEASTTLTDVSADRLQIWKVATASHEDVRDVFINTSRITGVKRVEQRVGEKVDVVLTYNQPTNEQVPALADIVAYIQQERLGTGSVVNKHFNITRNNIALHQDAETIRMRGRRGRDGGEGRRRARGAAGKAQVLIQEAQINLVKKNIKSIAKRTTVIVQQDEVVPRR